MLSQPDNEGNDIRLYRHGVEDPNSTIFREIREADSKNRRQDKIQLV